MVAAAVSLLAQAPTPAVPDLNDHGTFMIYVAGKSIGTETFEIHVRPDQIDAQAEEHLQIDQNGKTISIQTTSNLVLDPQYDPVSYNWNQKGAQSSQLAVDFRTKPAHVRYKQVNGQEDRRDFKLDKDVVVLDDNVIHHYELALARYDSAKGGVQVFRGFTPQEALPGVLTINYMGQDQISLDGMNVPLRHYALTAELAQINLWADDQGRLQLLAATDLQFQARRLKEPTK